MKPWNRLEGLSWDELADKAASQILHGPRKELKAYLKAVDEQKKWLEKEKRKWLKKAGKRK